MAHNCKLKACPQSAKKMCTSLTVIRVGALGLLITCNGLFALSASLLKLAPGCKTGKSMYCIPVGILYISLESFADLWQAAFKNIYFQDKSRWASKVS